LCEAIEDAYLRPQVREWSRAVAGSFAPAKVGRREAL
jgi:hypothetical protein